MEVHVRDDAEANAGRISAMAAKPGVEHNEGSSETGSEDEEDREGKSEEDVEPATLGAVQARPDKYLSQRPEKRQRKAATPRAVVDEIQMVTLVKAYRVEFAEFCRVKKQIPKQMVPGKVWEKIYMNHYKPAFPESNLEENTLKKHLREQLAELGTGIADDGRTPVLQDEQIATELRNTDSAATGNMLRLRRSFLFGVGTSGTPSPSIPAVSVPPIAPSDPVTPATPLRAPNTQQSTHSAPTAGVTAAQTPMPATTNSTAPTAATTTPTSGSSTESQRLMKSEMLNRQLDAVCTIAKNFQDVAEKQSLLMDVKRAKHQLALLKEAKEYGVIDGEEFKKKLKELIKF